MFPCRTGHDLGENIGQIDANLEGIRDVLNQRCLSRICRDATAEGSGFSSGSIPVECFLATAPLPNLKGMFAVDERTAEAAPGRGTKGMTIRIIEQSGGTHLLVARGGQF